MHAGLCQTSQAALAVISCAYNNFVGNVPDEFAKLSSIQQLYLGASQLSGRFPQASSIFLP
jgi:hypothetical protein